MCLLVSKEKRRSIPLVHIGMQKDVAEVLMIGFMYVFMTLFVKRDWSKDIYE